MAAKLIAGWAVSCMPGHASTLLAASHRTEVIVKAVFVKADIVKAAILTFNAKSCVRKVG